MLDLVGTILIIQKYENGKWGDLIPWNLLKPFETGHGHLRSKAYTKKLCGKIMKNKFIGNGSSKYILKTVMKLTTEDYPYKKDIKDKLESRSTTNRPRNCKGYYNKKLK